MKRTNSWRDRITARLDATPSTPAAPGSRFASFRRLYRWLNLTLVHQGVWPLLILLAAAPVVRPAAAPFPWQLAATGAPAIAALIALLYLAQRRSLSHPTNGADSGPERPTPANANSNPLANASGKPAANPAPANPLPPPSQGRPGRRSRAPRTGPNPGSLPELVQGQARLLLFGVAIVLAVARLVIGPAMPTAAYLLFGVADVLAFQLIHFGVVAGSFAEPDLGQAAAILLFSLSWGLRELFLAGVGVGNAELGLAFGGGLAVGLVVALISRVLRRWPGGFWAGAAGHWLLIYLFFGFVG